MSSFEKRTSEPDSALNSLRGEIPKERRSIALRALFLIALLGAPCVYLNLLSLTGFQYPASLLLTPQPHDWGNLSSHCASIPPIPASEFHQRQKQLAQTLYSLNATAYIAEPGPNAQYYANISRYTWRLSERPFLLFISPQPSTISGEVEAEVSILAPQFEGSRARLLSIPTAGNVSFAEWAEDADPYAVAIQTLGSRGSGVVFVDEGTRYFVVDGLKAAAPAVTVKSSPAVRRLRESKSASEIDILRCANEVTLLAIRAVRERMYLGIRESEARVMIQDALGAAGLRDGGGLVLFGENAALPHGSGTDRVLGDHDFALFDVGGTLHGYYSDITRTFALPASTIPSEHLRIWFAVRDAQWAAHKAARAGVEAQEVDAAARTVIDGIGAGRYFTHRLGHGIGLEGHESPYLRGGNAQPLNSGNSFSNEPGIYIEGKLGVRLEDVFVVDQDGAAEFLTSRIGGPANTPWSP